MLSQEEIKELLDSKYNLYNRPAFIQTDPVQIPHLFERREDSEIAGFLAACLAWGQRKTIINKSLELMRIMDNKPYEFIYHGDNLDFKAAENFCHRTFNGTDAIYFLKSLKNIYRNHGGLYAIFEKAFHEQNSTAEVLSCFRNIFFELDHPERTHKHISDVSKGATAKRLNLFLRWMIRNDGMGVDLGLWKEISPALLYIPLDIHSGKTARDLGLLKRKQNDWKAVDELTEKLREFDPVDPVKYDFALFGLGAFKYLDI